MYKVGAHEAFTVEIGVSNIHTPFSVYRKVTGTKNVFRALCFFNARVTYSLQRFLLYWRRRKEGEIERDEDGHRERERGREYSYGEAER